MKFSRPVYLAILMCAYFATLKFRNFAEILYFESLSCRVFEWDTIYSSLEILFKMSLNLIKRLYEGKNNVKLKKNATAGRDVNGNNKTGLTMYKSSSCLYVNYCSWEKKIYNKNSTLCEPFNFRDKLCLLHLMFASLQFRDFFCIAKFAKLTCRENFIRY